MYFYRTYQRQQPDEHVRLADKVLDVELAADFAGPVGLRTSIHICNDRRRRNLRSVYYIDGVPKRARYAGRPTFARYYCIIIINKVAAQLMTIFYCDITIATVCVYLPIWYYVFILRLRPVFGVRPVADFVWFLCFVVFACVYKTRVLSNARGAAAAAVAGSELLAR